MHLVMEFCELGDLSSFIKKRASLASHPVTQDMIKKYPLPAVGGLNEVIVRHFLKQIASALEFLRSKNYVHRDIKPQNLLLVPSAKWYDSFSDIRRPFAVSENSLVPAVGLDSLPMLKVADFGFARVLPQTSLAETLCGSPLYMAPEILRYEKYDAKADLWSVGTVLHEMMVGKPPFRATNHVELLRKIERQDDKIKFPEGIIISDGMKKLIRGLLKKGPTERMTYETFFQHYVVKEDIPGLVGEDRPADTSASAGSLRRREEPVQTVIPTTGSTSPRERPLLSGTPPTRPQTHPVITTVTRKPSLRDQANREDSRLASPQSVRPPITSHATAPARQQPSAGALALERRQSHGRGTASPSASMLREHLERERNIRPQDRAIAEMRERAAQDVAFERDYVLVEKRAVEVNAFADELDAANPLSRRYQDRPTSPRDAAAASRRATTTGQPQSLPNNYSTPSRAIQIAPGRPRAEAHQRGGSYDRRYGSIPGSATSAISKALNMANVRLFGMGLSPPSGKGPSPPTYTAYPMYPTAQKSLLMIDDGGKKADASKDEDQRIVDYAEELAHRSDVVYGFAEVKYHQLVPATPSNEDALGIGLAERIGSADGLDDDLTIDAIVAVAEEALVLYVKALTILAKSIDIAGSWWGRKNRSPTSTTPTGALPTAGEGTSPNSLSPALSPRAGHAVGNRMNSVVQYCRNRFNECLEKSEFVRRKLIDAQQKLPLDHPGHPNNHPAESATGSSNSVATSIENFYLSSGITAERLMYDRAIEMSRNAAISELTNEDLPGCERSYITSIHLLEAVLTTDDEMKKATGISGKSRGDEDLINGLESEDRQRILDCKC